MLTTDNRTYPLFSLSPDPCSLQLANDVQSGCPYVPGGAGMSKRYIAAGGFQGIGPMGRGSNAIVQGVGNMGFGVPENLMLAGLAGIMLWLVYRRSKRGRR